MSSLRRLKELKNLSELSELSRSLVVCFVQDTVGRTDFVLLRIHFEKNCSIEPIGVFSLDQSRV